MTIPRWLLHVLLLLPSALVPLLILCGYLIGSPGIWILWCILSCTTAALILLPLISRRSLGLAYLSLTLILVPLALGLFSAVDVPVAHSSELAAKLFVTEAIETPLTAYRIHLGRYPTTHEGLAALVHAPAGLEAKWKGPYVEDEKKFLDPWGHPYRYRCPGVHHPDGYDLSSAGPDGQSGTADDIGNW